MRAVCAASVSVLAYPVRLYRRVLCVWHRLIGVHAKSYRPSCRVLVVRPRLISVLVLSFRLLNHFFKYMSTNFWRMKGSDIMTVNSWS